MEQNKKKSQQKPAQTTAPFEGPYKTKPSAIAGKSGIGYSTVRHLARMGMKKAIDRLAKEEYVEEGNYVPTNVHINPNEKFAKEKEVAHNAAVEKAKQMVKQRVNKEETELVTFKSFRTSIQEKTLTAAEKKKREEVAQAIERENPNMPMAMKMAIATKTAKRVAEEDEFKNLDEAVKTTHEDPLVTVHDKDGLHTHANLSTANHIFKTNVKHTDVHKGPVTVTSGREDKNKLKFAISMHHAKAVNEETEEGQHYCAKHVRSALLGDGVVLEAQHADPDENGNIEWYMVEFKDGIHKVFTEDIEIMLAEYHGNHKKKKR